MQSNFDCQSKHFLRLHLFARLHVYMKQAEIESVKDVARMLSFTTADLHI